MRLRELSVIRYGSTFGAIMRFTRDSDTVPPLMREHACALIEITRDYDTGPPLVREHFLCYDEIYPPF